jgi:hypothetical protein
MKSWHFNYITILSCQKKHQEQSGNKIDKRLTKRELMLKNRMKEKNTVVINQLSENRSDTVGLCRYLHNESITMENLISEQTLKVNAFSFDKHVLVLNDTTEINYQSHINFLDKADTDLGPVGNNTDIGYFLHPGLVIDTSTAMGIGYSYIHIWNRQWDKQDKLQRDYQTQAIEEKESYRWIDCAQKSKETLSSARAITIVADRESDIYEEFVTVPDERTDLLIRSKQNRNLFDGNNLYGQLESTPISHQYDLKVRTTKNHTGRDTVMQVKFTKVKIKRPVKAGKTKSLPEYVELNVVEAKEDKALVPAGEKPIHWILLTTHEITNYEQALQIIAWYAMRWQIELLFSTLKTAGLNIEASEIESGKALKKLCIMALEVALQINQLRQARQDDTEIPATLVFTKQQLAFIKIIIPKYEGKTEKQTNLYKEETLAWAAWLIARLGGWKGYDSESPPGNKTFKWGLDRFNAAYKGYLIALELCA